jgi:UDP-N-acetylmuramate dehydrogenase
VNDLGLLEVRGRLEPNVILGPFTSWRVGGPADWFFEPEDAEDFADFLRQLPAGFPVTVLGLGSNVLIRDAGIEGVVVHLAGKLNQRRRLDDVRIEFGAGLACAQAARYCAAEGLTGAEFLAGIPGTIGGALAMNAGAWGGETWPLVEWVETVDRAGQVIRRDPKEYRAGYREVRGPANEWFLRAGFVLVPGETAPARARIRALLRERAAKQPLGEPSCGSVFRNPDGAHAAALIESLGLKGLSSGAAVVSAKHANFITHDGLASARDIENLIREVQMRVRAAHGIALQCEVRIIGREGVSP